MESAVAVLRHGVVQFLDEVVDVPVAVHVRWRFRH